MADRFRAVFALIVVTGCAAKIASSEIADAGDVADSGTIADATPSSVDATAVVDAVSEEASGPKICDPQDTRTCEVATAAEGVPCPATFEEAKATFMACTGAPIGSRWFYGQCSTYFIASIGTFAHSTQCFYGLDTHALVGSYGYDDCGAFCGGVNHVHWGVDSVPCGIAAADQGLCGSDAGADAAADAADDG